MNILKVVTEEWKDDHFCLAHAVRPCQGEYISGDEILFQRKADYAIFGVIDGLGHGRAAAEVAQAVRIYFEEKEGTKDLIELVKTAHQNFLGSRGAVIALVKVFNNGDLEYLGIGNIRARIIRSHDDQIELIPKDGALGIRMRTISSCKEKLNNGDRLLLFSDGVSRNLIRQKSLMPKRNPIKFVHNVIKSFGKMHDDASVIYLIKTDERV